MKNLYILPVVLGALILCVWPKYSYADWGVGVSLGSPGYHDNHHYYRWHDHPHYGWHSHYLPARHFRVWVGGVGYYYYDGLYYSYVNGDYVIVSPPVGAVVATIPPDFQPVVINGATYYVNNGTYYVQTPSGYQVVSQPVQAAPVAVINTPNAVTVNVPSHGGGYVAVTLRRSGNGYVGPQGEFYSVFPRISQLQTMYGR